MPQVFDESNEQFAPLRRRLRDVLSDDEYAASRRTVTTAFYTPPQLTRAIWSGLQSAGFTGGRVLEPGVGTGGFIDSAAPNTHIVGIERDPLAAQIASARFPDSQIRQEDFAQTDIDDDSFAATVGNVPFTQTTPYDPRHNRAGLSDLCQGVVNGLGGWHCDFCGRRGRRGGADDAGFVWRGGHSWHFFDVAAV